MSKLLTQLFYKNKTINLVFIILMIVGLFCYFNISKEAEPDVKMPYIYIYTRLCIVMDHIYIYIYI